MKVFVIVAALCLAAVTARAEPMTKTDLAIQAAVGLTLAADYLQTREIVADGREGNPIMGKSGHLVAPEAYFLSAALLHTAVVMVLPKPYRTIAQGVVIGWQVEAVATNWRAGYAITF